MTVPYPKLAKKIVDRIGVLSKTRGLIHRCLLRRWILGRRILHGLLVRCHRMNLLGCMHLRNSRLLLLILALSKRLGSRREIRL
jgi:hypothetical protein